MPGDTTRQIVSLGNGEVMNVRFHMFGSFQSCCIGWESTCITMLSNTQSNLMTGGLLDFLTFVSPMELMKQKVSRQTTLLWNMYLAFIFILSPGLWTGVNEESCPRRNMSRLSEDNFLHDNTQFLTLPASNCFTQASPFSPREHPQFFKKFFIRSSSLKKCISIVISY